jgi:superfamily II DNA or RNA helicase
MSELFQAVRESCTPALWSKAVELARTGTFSADRQGDTITVNVTPKDAAVRPIVSLYEEDLDWQCTCVSDDDPCQHVAAAVIAIRRAREKGEDLPSAAADTGRVIYEFSTQTNQLLLQRTISSSAASQPLTTTLSALTSGRVNGPSVITSPTDMEIDILIGSDRSGLLAPQKIPELLQKMATGNCTVNLDGTPVKTSAEPTGLEIVISDDGPGVRVRAQKPSAVSLIYKNGYAVVGDDGKERTLHPAVLPESGPQMSELLSGGRFVARQEFGTFVSTVLPALQQRYPVKVLTSQLPTQSHGKARLELQLTDRWPAGLEVAPAIVYGDPVNTRIADGRVSHSGPKVSARSADDELKLKDELWRLFKLELGPAILLPAEQAFDLLAKIPTFRGDVTGDGAEKWKFVGRLTPEISWQDEFPEASFFAQAGGTRLSAGGERVFQAWTRGESMVRLDGGGFASLPLDWLDQSGDILAWMFSAKEHAKPGTAALRAVYQAAEDLGIALPPAAADLRARFTRKTDPSAFPALTATLRPYQEDGIAWLHTLAASGQGGILADDMGLGKTLQTISVLKKPSLVVAPTSVLTNWQREIEKFRPGLKAVVFHGSQRRLDPEADVIITSYNLVRLAGELRQPHWSIVVADEAQFMKNPDSQIFAAMSCLKASARFALTGTPIENRLSDLWAQMEFVNPGLLGGRKYFAEVVASRIGKGDTRATEHLRNRIRPYFLRRLKTEVARDLPPKTQMIRSVELSEAEQALYQRILINTRSDLEKAAAEDKEVSSLRILEMLLRLRQACCHPDLLPGISGYRSSKVEEAVEMIATLVEEEHKILIFSQWTSYLDLIGSALADNNIPTLRIDGSTDARQAVVDRFQSSGTEQVLLMSLKAGGTGLNLTAADHVLIVDPWWNPAAEEQALSRAWRIGQDKPVFVHKFVAASTIEESILQLQAAKQHLSDSVTGEGFADAPDLQDIMKLLEEQAID